MKNSIQNVADRFDLSIYTDLSLWVFVLIGLIGTILIQSSSAMIVIVLSALNAGLLTIYQSVAIVIGANIGTTSTLIIASINGSADKKRLATANVIFNLVAGTICFLLLKQYVYFTVHFFGINEPLMELVFLNTIINLTGIVLFTPFIPALARFLNKQFRKSEPSGKSLYIKNVDPQISDVALKALDNEISRVYSLVEEFILDCLLIGKDEHNKPYGLKNIFKTEKNLLDTYNQLKSIEDEIINYYIQIQKFNLSESETDLTANYMLMLRSMIMAAKNIKDVSTNIKQMSDSKNELAGEVLKRLQDFAVQNLNKLNQLSKQEIDQKTIVSLHSEYEKFYNLTIDFLYKSMRDKSLEGVSVSSITNAIKKTVSSLEELANSLIKQKYKNEA